MKSKQKGNLIIISVIILGILIATDKVNELLNTLLSQLSSTLIWIIIIGLIALWFFWPIIKGLSIIRGLFK